LHPMQAEYPDRTVKNKTGNKALCRLFEKVSRLFTKQKKPKAAVDSSRR